MLNVFKNSFLLIIFYLIVHSGCSYRENNRKNFNLFVNDFNALTNNNLLNPKRMSQFYLSNQLKEIKDQLEVLREIDIEKLDFNDQIDPLSL